MERILSLVLGLTVLLVAAEPAGADIFFEKTRGKGGQFIADDNGKHVRPFHPPKGVPAGEQPMLADDSRAGVFYGPGRTVTVARTPSGKILKRAKVSGCVVAGLAVDLKHVFCSKSGTVSLNARVSVFATSTLRGPVFSEHTAGAAFGPNGKSVAWNEGFQVFVAGADGSGKRLLADMSQLGDDAPVSQVQLAEWGPGQIALIGQSRSASRDIWLVDDASGTPRRLTHFPPKDENCSGHAMHPLRFSRDGTRLLAAGGVGE